MPIDPEALRRFLDWDPPALPDFKGAEPSWLRSFIRKHLGVDYAPRTPPRAPQLEGLAMMSLVGRGMLLYDMRMGKSKIALDWAEMLRTAGKFKQKGLIICHAPLGVDEWGANAADHSRLRVTPIYSGAGIGDRFVDALQDNTDLIAIPWSALQQLFCVKKTDRKKRTRLTADTDALRAASEFIDLVIIDEIHRCQDPGSVWFQLAAGLVRNAYWRCGLSGTIMGRNPFTAWAPWFLIDDGVRLGRSYHFFEEAFGKKERVYAYAARRRDKQGPYKLVFDEKKKSIFRARIASNSLSYLRGEVTTENVYTGQITLRMQGAQRDAYDAKIEEMIALRNGEIDAIENAFIRLRQISAGFLPFSDDEGDNRVVRFHKSAKAEWLDDFCSRLPEGVPIMIVHYFVHSGRIITDVLAKRKIQHRWLWGGAKDKPGIIRDFKAGNVPVLVANSDAVAMALDLPSIDYILFYESPVSPKIRAQVEARPMSRGARLLEIDDLVVSPVDRKVLSYVRDGKNILADLVHARHQLGLVRGHEKLATPRRRNV